MMTKAPQLCDSWGPSCLQGGAPLPQARMTGRNSGSAQFVAFVGGSEQRPRELAHLPRRDRPLGVHDDLALACK